MQIRARRLRGASLSLAMVAVLLGALAPTRAAATATTTTEQVVPATARVAFGSTSNPSGWQQSLTLNATVSPSPGAATPTGTLTFEDGTTVLGTATLDGSGHGWLTVSSLSPGTHPLTAVYAGDSNYSTVSAALTQGILASAWVNVVPSPYWVRPGEPVTLSTTVNGVQGGPTPTGSVTFVENTVPLGTAALDAGGRASLTITEPNLGLHYIYPTYSGDAAYWRDADPIHATWFRVAKGDSVVLSPSSNPSVPGQAVTFIATVVTEDGGTPTGSITFSEGQYAPPMGPALAGVALDASGSATFTTSSLTAGSHRIMATYDGDGSSSNGYYGYTAGTDAVIQTITDATPSRRFVNQLYNDILGRSGDDGAAIWASELDHRQIDRTHIALALSNSTEYITGQVQASYLAHLGREADAGGFEFWLAYIHRGATFEDLEISFLGAPEFYRNAGNTHDTFLTALYVDVFGRDVDTGGRRYWDGRLAQGTPAWQVAASVVKSYEAMSSRVTDDYLLLLGRDPDIQGRDSWTALLQQGSRDETLLAQLAGSDEYWNLAQAY
jgi:hypothetical protein